MKAEGTPPRAMHKKESSTKCWGKDLACPEIMLSDFFSSETTPNLVGLQPNAVESFLTFSKRWLGRFIQNGGTGKNEE